MTTNNPEEARPPVWRTPEAWQRRLGLVVWIVLALVAASCSSGEESNVDSASANESQDFIAWASDNALPIESLDLDARSSDLDGLAGIVGDAQIVAVGETAHNVREQIQTRSRLLAHLVEDVGFRLLAVETSMPHAEKINDYVLGDDADIDELLRQSGTWELMATEEMRAVIEWIRQYNSTVTNEDFVEFYGIDVTTPLPALESLDTYLGTVDEPLARDWMETFDRLRVLLSQQGTETWRTIQTRYDEAARDDLAALSTQLKDLRTQIQTKAQDYVTSSSLQEYDQALRWADVLASGHETLSTQATAGPPDTPERVKAGSTVRDPAMADNALWILGQHPGQRMVLWANNLHVQRNDPDRTFNVGDSFQIEGLTTMGSELDAALGSSYLVVHATLHAGNAPDYGQLPDAARDSLDGVLNLTGPTLFYLDLRSVPEDRPAAAWIGSPQSMRAEIGTLTLLPIANFDAVYFVSEGTPAHELG